MGRVQIEHFSEDVNAFKGVTEKLRDFKVNRPLLVIMHDLINIVPVVWDDTCQHEKEYHTHREDITVVTHVCSMVPLHMDHLWSYEPRGPAFSMY